MDPLAQLKDIQLPSEIHNYPLAIGWWILAVLIIAIIIFTVVKIQKTRKQQQAQKQAIKALLNQEPSVEHAVSVLKWAALQYFPREQVANLYGESFQRFLTTQLPHKNQQDFIDLCGASLENQYQTNNNVNDENFHQASLLWLKKALPPKLPTPLTKKELMEADA